MVNDPSVMIRQLRKDDIGGALQLCRSAGWNQLREDWKRLIEYQPQGCFAATVDETLVGTVTTTSYGKDLGWIGMMLVHEDFRRRGIATQLMQTSIDYLRDHRVACIKLDATPAGAHVYERFGFQSEFSFQRFARTSFGEPEDQVTQPNGALRDPHFQMDRFAFGADRGEWIRKMSSDSTVVVSEEGFGMLRAGFLADYLGPVVASSGTGARDLIGRCLEHSFADQIFWDVLHPRAASLAHSMDFVPVRDLTRMRLGTPLHCEGLERQFAICDPAVG